MSIGFCGISTGFLPQAEKPVRNGGGQRKHPLAAAGKADADTVALPRQNAPRAIGAVLHRISRLTKAAMRLAIYEMRYVDDVPNGVAINECVELTRKYEDAQVVSFVNGILGSVARGAKPNTEAPADPQPEEAQPEETPSEETQPAPEEAQQP